jgi:Domain of unknown function (DUF834).
LKRKRGFIASAARVSVDRAHGRRFTRTDGRDQTDPRWTAEIDRVHGGSRRTALMTPAMTSPTAAAARRSGRLGRRTLAGERRREDAHGGYQRVADGTANSPATKATAERQRTAPATRRKRRALRVNDGDDAPVVSGDGEGADEDGDATATTTTVFPSDGDGWSDGGARLERRRRRRS